MASSLVLLLSLALFATAIAAPVPDEAETTTTGSDVALVEVLEVVETIPVIALAEDPKAQGATSTETSEEPKSDATTKEAEHKIAKRSALRGDNPSNDLLANLEGLQYENGLSGLAGRKIKFLPTWLG